MNLTLTRIFKRENTKPAIKKKSDGADVRFDLLYQLSYMSVIAASGAPRAQIFAQAARTPCAASEYFKRIELASEKLRYDYAKACRTVGESVKDETIKGLLLRFSSSLISGEPEAEFLTREAEAEAETYNNIYARKLETLKMWTDAYVSLILSAVLVTIIGTVSTMVWKIETAFIIGLAFISTVTALIGVWLIHLMTPRESVVLKKPGSVEQKLTGRLFRLVLPIAISIGAILMFLKLNAGIPLIVIGLIIFPLGVIMTLDDRKITKRDGEAGSFLRSLGGVCSATGTTVRDAIGRLDLDAMYNLRHEVKWLHGRMLAGISGKLCWSKFIEESGSEVINRSVGMFYDAIDLGGEAGNAGYQASLFASKIAMLRARRKTVSQPFQWLCIAMHAAVVALLIFTTQIITLFGKMVESTTSNMPKISGAPGVASFNSFNFQGLELMNTLVVPLVVVFTVANALAPNIADGGSRFKALFNLGITSMISGFGLLVLPKIAVTLFSSVKM